MRRLNWGRHWGISGLIVLLLIFVPAIVRAQIDSGNIAGQVIDETGAALPGVTITVRNASTGQVRTAVTATEGRYLVAGLPPAKYSVSAELTGFATVVRSDVTVNVAAVLDLNIPMKVAAVNETITVTGEAPLVQSAKTEMSSVVTGEMIAALPSRSRDYLDLTLLRPATGEAVVNGENGSGFEVGGAKGHQAALLIDGFYNLDIAFIQPKQRPSEDLVQEFQMVTFGGSAEYGRAIGGIVNVVTKSGANAFHGSGYGFFRNTNLNAEDPGLVAAGQPKPSYDRQQWGGVFGGPIKQNKVFFIGSAERLNQDQPTNTGITAASIASIGLPSDASLMPRGLISNFSFGKVDYNISNNQRLQANFSFTRQLDTVSWNFTQTTRSRWFQLHPDDYSASVKWQANSSNGQMLHEVKVSYFPRRYFVDGLPESGAPICSCTLNSVWPNPPSAPPKVTISGVASFGSAGLVDDFNTDPVEGIYTSTIFKDKHVFKFGADYMYAPQQYNRYDPLNGTYTFSSVSNFLAGRYTQYTQQFGGVALPRTWQMVSGFVQDSWRAGSRLTINYGLRYDLDFPVKYWLTGTPFGKTDYNNFGPRVGLSFDMTGKSTTFLKVASGVFYDRIWGNDSNNMFTFKDQPERASATWTPTTPGAPVYPFTFAAQPANLPAGVLDVMIMPTNASTPTTAQTTATVEHLLRPGVSISATGVYTRTWYNPYTLDTNLAWDSTLNGGKGGYSRINPSYRRITQVNYGAHAMYAGAILEMEQRGKRIGSSANLTIAHSRGVESVDDPYTFQTQGFTPFYGPNPDTPVARGTLSGYYNVSPRVQIAGSFKARSGLPVNPIASGVDVYGTGVLSLRPPALAPYSFLTPSTSEVDLKAVWNIPLGGSDKHLQFHVETYNLFNHDNVMTVQNNYGNTIGTPSATFLQPLLYFPPREVQLGFRYTF